MKTTNITLYRHAVLAALFPSATIMAGEDRPSLSENDSLPDYVAYGIAHNPGLQAAWNDYQAALEKIPQAKSLPDPKVTATHFVEAIQTRTGPQENQLFLSQMIPWFGKLKLRGAVASKEAEAVHHAWESAVLDTARDISLAYYDYAWLGEDTRITREILELLDRLEESVREKVRAGNDLAPLLRLEVEIGKSRDALQTLTKRRASESAAIHALLGSPERKLLPFPKIPKPAANDSNRAALVGTLLNDNPALKLLRSRIDKAAEAVKLSKKSPIPDPTIGVGVFGTGDAVDPRAPGSGENPWAIQLSFSIPLWSGKYKAEKKEARARYEAAKKSLTDRENHLVAELESILQDLSEFDQRIELYEETLLPKARQALEVTESSYQGDRSTILDLIDSERTLLEIERNYWRAVAGHFKATTRLQTLTGNKPQ